MNLHSSHCAYQPFKRVLPWTTAAAPVFLPCCANPGSEQLLLLQREARCDVDVSHSLADHSDTVVFFFLVERAGWTSARCCSWVLDLTAGSVIVFVMGSYHNMESGYHRQCLINGLWESLRSSSNVCSTGLKCFLLWDKSYTNIALGPALFSFSGSGSQWVTHKLFLSISKGLSNTDGLMRCVQKIALWSVSVWLPESSFDSCALQPIQRELRQAHNVLSLGGGLGLRRLTDYEVLVICKI